MTSRHDVQAAPTSLVQSQSFLLSCTYMQSAVPLTACGKHRRSSRDVQGPWLLKPAPWRAVQSHQCSWMQISQLRNSTERNACKELTATHAGAASACPSTEAAKHVSICDVLTPAVTPTHSLTMLQFVHQEHSNDNLARHPQQHGLHTGFERHS